MLIDDLREQGIHLASAKIRDAIVFRIHERADGFGISQVKDDLEPLPSLLPYNNMVIHFDGFCMWYLMEEVDLKDRGGCQYVMMGSWFAGAHELNYYNETPDAVFLSYIDKVSLSCIGMNIFYPHTKKLEYGQGEVATESPESECMGNSYKYLQAFLTLLSCKNIRADLEKPNDKIQKKRASKGKLPLVSYYVLKIRSMARGHESEDRGLWTNRVHFCRGHMREYTASAPLFGRFVGRFWIPPHVRGNKKKGMIMKDYEVPVKTNGGENEI